jgi:hypothetical protein
VGDKRDAEGLILEDSQKSPLRSQSPDPLTAASSFEDKRRAQTMNELEEKIFLEGLPF